MTVIPFNPSSNSNFRFAVTMDTIKYNCVVNWNLFGQRFYISMFDINSNRVFTLPVISSPQGFDINIAGGYFQNSSLVFRSASNQFEVTP